MINAENAALKAPKFAKPNDRARHAIFDDIIEEFTAYTKADKTEKSSEKLASKNDTSRPNSRGEDTKASNTKENIEQRKPTKAISSVGVISKRKYRGGGSMNDLRKDYDTSLVSAAAASAQAATTPRASTPNKRFSLIPSLMNRRSLNAKDLDVSPKSPLKLESPALPAIAGDPLEEED